MSGFSPMSGGVASPLNRPTFFFELVRLSGLEPLTCGPGDQE
ncbi:hypothetical protein [Pseudoalteromonas sp.]